MSQKHYELSAIAPNLKQSGIRSVSQLCKKVQGINLGQGICDIAINQEVKNAAFEAIQNDKNIYSAYEGVYDLRLAIANKLNSFNQLDVDPHTEVMVTHGATGAYVCAAQVLFNPGDEVILFQPYYGYHQKILELYGVKIKAVTIDLNDYSIDLEQLQASINPKTRGIVICTPGNPSGKVFTKEELISIGKIAEENDLYIITDEMYEFITYPGYKHVSIARLENFAERTITISGLSKTYNMTGWRLGYAVGPETIIEKMALMHDLIYVCPATPLQHAAIRALELPQSYYDDMRQSYLKKRDLMCDGLKQLGFQVTVPQGAYYLMVDISEFAFADDFDAMQQILQKAKIAVVPGSSFYYNQELGKKYLRLCYAVSEEKLQQALQQLQTMVS